MSGLTTQDILDAGLDDWRKLTTHLHARFLTGDFVTGLRFVTAVTEAAEAANHHPDVTLTYPWVDLRLISHDVDALTSRDVDLAREISRIAADLGVAADPTALSVVEIGLDTADVAALGPVWSALLSGSADGVDGNDVVDPQQRAPLVWFQDTEAHETPRQRFHLDVWVPHDQLDQRIAAAVEAGAEVVDESHGPSFVVLADPEGNKACLCTILERG